MISPLTLLLLAPEVASPEGAIDPHRDLGAPPLPTDTGWERLASGILLWSVELGVVVLAIAIVMALARILRGPTLVDRGIAADLIAILVAGVALLLTIRFASQILFDAVLIVSILGFASMIAFAQYIGRRRSAE